MRPRDELDAQGGARFDDAKRPDGTGLDLGAAVTRDRGRRTFARAGRDEREGEADGDPAARQARTNDTAIATNGLVHAISSNDGARAVGGPPPTATPRLEVQHGHRCDVKGGEVQAAGRARDQPRQERLLVGERLHEPGRRGRRGAAARAVQKQRVLLGAQQAQVGAPRERWPAPPSDRGTPAKRAASARASTIGRRAPRSRARRARETATRDRRGPSARVEASGGSRPARTGPCAARARSACTRPRQRRPPWRRPSARS